MGRAFERPGGGLAALTQWLESLCYTHRSKTNLFPFLC